MSLCKCHSSECQVFTLLVLVPYFAGSCRRLSYSVHIHFQVCHGAIGCHCYGPAAWVGKGSSCDLVTDRLCCSLNSYLYHCLINCYLPYTFHFSVISRNSSLFHVIESFMYNNTANPQASVVFFGGRIVMSRSSE